MNDSVVTQATFSTGAPTFGLREQMDVPLAEGIPGAIERERTEFDNLTGRFKDSLVLFGARKIPGCGGRRIDSIRVLSPRDAEHRFGSEAAFVITIWGYGSSDFMRQRVRGLHELGCKTVVTFVPSLTGFTFPTSSRL